MPIFITETGAGTVPNKVIFGTNLVSKCDACFG